MKLLVVVLVLAAAHGAWAQGRVGAESEAKAAFAEAKALLGQDKPQEAEVLLRKAIARNPEFAEAYEALSALLYGRERYAEGEVLMRRALERVPASNELKAQLAMHLHARNRLSQAHKLFKEVLGTVPQRYAIQAVAGKCCLQVGDYACAAQALENYLRSRPAALKPRDYRFQVLLATAYLEEKRLDRAEAVLTPVMRTQPNYEPAQLTMADLHLAKGECGSAVTLYERLVKANAKPGLRLKMAQGYLCLRRYRDALSQASAVLQKAPGDSQAILVRGDAEAALGMSDRALADFQSVRRKLGASAPVTLRIAKVLFKLRRYKEVLKETGENLEPDLMVLGIRAAVRARQKERAVELARSLLTQKGIGADHLYYAAVAHSAAGLYQEAITTYERVLKMSPTHRGAKSELVKTLCWATRSAFRKKEFAAVVSTMERATRLDPNSLVVTRNLALAYLESGQPEKALHTIDRLLRKTPKDYVGNRLAGHALVALKRHLEAQARFDAAVDAMRVYQGPPLARALTESAFNQMVLKNHPRAIRELKRALELVGKDKALRSEVRRNIASASVTLADQALAAGKPQEAWGSIEQALEYAEDLPPEQRAPVQTLATIVALSTGHVAKGKALLAGIGAKATLGLRPPFDKLGKKLIEAYVGYLDPDIASKQAGVAQFEKMLPRLTGPARTAITDLVVSGHEQIAERLYAAGKTKVAQRHYAKINKLAKGRLSTRQRHNLAVIDYYLGKRAAALASLETIKTKVPKAYCNLGIHQENSGSRVEALELFRKCDRHGAIYPELKALVLARQRLEGY